MEWNAVLEAVSAMGWIEALAVLLALAYVLLAAAESIWCWPAAFVSTSLYLYLCLAANLWAESGLQLFYIVMAVVGWVQWRRRGHRRRQAVPESGHPLSEGEQRPIVQWPLRWHLLIVLANTALTLLIGWLLARYTPAANPYLDSFTTVFSLVTTWMVTQKVLENWLYWIVIDAASIFLYASREFTLTPYLFGLYTLIALAGYLRWRKQYLSHPLA
ncbi:nicotinamide riboside transporter PnuC [Cesiribacter andamanensis]|uniref:Nicotinamide riboside transporter PnuC n=1 Tax=Cesiribacter andamanensis AMV16 TaxID=1279009 RepID=M7NLL6_9BACT|nr:nicotinamide riboside transporter PnuC [Cesiribacter andamanensis]EMR02675.1 Nicotinamide riboside transporter pnuC [Cesiribacter andamanensis AMV16]